jgi:fimbrial chaperone protein
MMRVYAYAIVWGVTILSSTAVLAKGQLQVKQIAVEIPAGAKASRMLLGNNGDQPVSVQVRVYAWSQQAEQELLTTTETVAVSPPISEIAAGGEQIIRVVLQSPTPSAQDQMYRVVIDELPQLNANNVSAIGVRLRYILPLYVRAENAKAANITCQLLSSEILQCANKGGRAAQLGATALLDGLGGKYMLSKGLFGYILPNSTRTWSLTSSHIHLGQAYSWQLETMQDAEPTVIKVDRAR